MYDDRLTDRELLCLVLLAQGYLYGQVAERFSVSEKTIKTHMHNAFYKLRVKNRIEAFQALGWINIPVHLTEYLDKQYPESD